MNHIFHFGDMVYINHRPDGPPRAIIGMTAGGTRYLLVGCDGSFAAYDLHLAYCAHASVPLPDAQAIPSAGCYPCDGELVERWFDAVQDHPL